MANAVGKESHFFGKRRCPRDSCLLFVSDKIWLRTSSTFTQRPLRDLWWYFFHLFPLETNTCWHDIFTAGLTRHQGYRWMRASGASYNGGQSPPDTLMLLNQPPLCHRSDILDNVLLKSQRSTLIQPATCCVCYSFVNILSVSYRNTFPTSSLACYLQPPSIWRNSGSRDIPTLSWSWCWSQSCYRWTLVSCVGQWICMEKLRHSAEWKARSASVLLCVRARALFHFSVFWERFKLGP